MSQYRAYLVGKDRHIKVAWDIECGTDQEAMAEAGSLILAHAADIPDTFCTVELWEGARYISLFQVADHLPH